MSNPALDAIRELIQNDELDRACELLMSLAREVSRELYNESILHSGRLRDVLRRQRKGLIAPNDRSEWMQLKSALLDFTDELERALKRSAVSADATAPVNLKPSEDSFQEKIFGVSHLKSLSWLRQGLAMARSVCRILTPTARGTGFLIADGRVLTNHHVLPDRDSAAKAEFELGYEEDENGRVLATSRYRARADTFNSNESFDCAVVQLEPAAGLSSLESWGALTLETQTPSVGEHVTIIQHPNGGLKQIALTANQVVNVYDHRLQYTTDTLPGSSGAPVFNDHWRVVAVHHAGGNMVKNARGERMFANEGILSPHVVRALGL